VEQLLSVSGLTEHRRKWPYQLSGGMKMRLSLVRALAARPRMLLMDEPFGALDSITRNRLHDEFASLHKSRGFSALFVTHAIDEAVYLADRVLVMSEAPGRIVREFTVPFARPRTSALRYSPEFASLCGAIAESLHELAGGA
jgi:NitT/TauT family transport system ATP-binding protein